MQALGEQLIELDDELLDSLPLDERLRQAIAEARSMKSREALRRHKQYIGKLMRAADLDAIEALLSRLRADERRRQRLFANAEQWRDRLLHDGERALAEFTAVTGRADARLAELLGDVARATSDRAETTAKRAIFRRVHATLAATSRDR